MGDIIEDHLGGYGANMQLSRAAGEQSGYTVVINPPGVDRIFLHCPGTNNTFTSRDMDFSDFWGARLFHFGYPTIMRRFYENEGVELAALFRKARETGVTTSLDTTLPDPLSESGKANWPAILAKTLAHVDIFVPSIEEALIMLMPEAFRQIQAKAGGSDILDAVTGQDLARLTDRVLEAGAAIAMIKVGHRGCYLRTASASRIAAMGAAAPADPERFADREIWQPAYRAPLFASATGAGDAAIAGFLAAVLKGKSPSECLKFAALLGWQNVQTYDALSGIKTWADTEKDFAAGLAPMPMASPGPRWAHHREKQIWIGPQDRNATQR